MIAFLVWAVGFAALLSWVFDGEFTLQSIVIVGVAGLVGLVVNALGERAWWRVRREQD